MNLSLILAVVVGASNAKLCATFRALTRPISRNGDDDTEQQHGAAEEAEVAEKLVDAQR